FADQPVVCILTGAVKRDVQALHSLAAQPLRDGRAHSMPAAADAKVVRAQADELAQQLPPVAAPQRLAAADQERTGAPGDRVGGPDDLIARELFVSPDGTATPRQARPVAYQRQSQVDVG